MNTHAAYANRTIHLIDIENLCGQAAVTVDRAREARAAYEKRIAIGPHDHVVIASARASVFAAYTVWPEARRMWRDGKDGADICLASVIAHEHIERRYGSVVLASGDGGFTEFVDYLTARGTRVTVVTGGSHLSHRLSVAASKIVCLRLPELAPLAQADYATAA